MALVHIFMTTFKGERFLQKQLDSIAWQTYSHWLLHISDDTPENDADNTRIILQRFQEKFPEKVIVCGGPQKGFAENFLSFFKKKGIRGDFFAFSDQDDVWHPQKLEVAIKKIENVQGPALYGGKTRLIDDKGRGIGYSKKFKKSPSFANALVQCIAGGNTMVFNRKAFELIQCSLNQRPVVYSHDWWAYQIVSGAGGVVVYDSVPFVDYRQHGRNMVGSNRGVKFMVKRLLLLFDGTYKKMLSSHWGGLKNLRTILKDPSFFDDIMQVPQENSVERLKIFLKHGLNRQSWWQNIIFRIAALFGKV